MRTIIFLFKSVMLLLIVAFCITTCVSTIPENSDSDRTFIESIQKQVNHQITWHDAVENLEEVHGGIVKWSGRIIRVWEDKIQVYRYPSERYSNNNFLLLLDHPLPSETNIGELKQTVVVGNTIWMLGKITEVRDIVTERGNDIKVPVLKGFVISKDNDRNFEKPVWVSNK